MSIVYLYAMGCTENLIDAQRYREFFIHNNYEMTSKISEADIIVLITCGVTSYAADECCDVYLKIIQNKKDEAKVYIGGCLPVIEKERIDALNAVTFYSSGGDIEKFADVLGIKEYVWSDERFGHHFYNGIGNCETENGAVTKPKGFLADMIEFEDSMSVVYEGLGMKKPNYFHTLTEEYYHDSYFVNVGIGCGGVCTYCAIKFVKGEIKSKSIDSIVQEVKTGIEKGNDNIILSGDDVGSYGKDLGIDFYDLMNEINKIDGDFSITVRNFEPFWMVNNTDKMKKLIQSGRINCISIPIQTANDVVLANMGRKYSSSDVMECVKDLKKLSPGLICSTHIMVGFPGETDEQFQETIDLINEGIFDFLHCSMYTDRPNTPASKRTDKISYLQKAKRMKVLYEVIDGLNRRKCEELVQGTLKEVKDKLGEIINEK